MGVWGCVALKTPFSCQFIRVPFQAKEVKSQFTGPPFEKNLEILAFTASQAPNLKISVHKTLFQTQKSVHKPHNLEMRATHPYLKKS